MGNVFGPNTLLNDSCSSAVCLHLLLLQIESATNYVTLNKINR